MTSSSPLPGLGAIRQSSTVAAFRFYLLGELRILHNGDQVPSPTYRTHSLLATLLLHPRPQRRDRLIGLLFPDMPERAGRRRLSDLLWLLRRSLPELPLETSIQEVYLSPEIRWLDVEAFRQAAAQPNLCDWLEALSLYRGDLLESVYDDWLLEERETLYLQHIQLLHRASDLLLQRQQCDEALPLAERLVQVEPYDEKALRTLMQVYRALGRRGAALAAYERFVSLAADELGVDPDPATQALAQALRSIDSCACLRSTPSPPADDSPDALLRHGQEALTRGDRVTVEDCLRLLRSTSSADRVRLLEIDAALFFEESDRAERLLQSCDCRLSPVQVRIARLAMERRNHAAALDAASEALILAHEAGDPQSELDALLVLAQAQRQMGQGVQAERSADQALSLARACASPICIACALILKGYGQIRQGSYTQALSLFHEARSLAHEHGLRRHLAEALHWICVARSYQGALLDALATGQEALTTWRDLGLQGWEVTTLQRLSSIYAQLGRTAESLRTLEQAQEINKQSGQAVRVAISQYHMTGNLLYHDDALAARAATEAQQALDVFRTHEQSGWEAATLAMLGYALWVGEQYDEALTALRQAYALHERLGEMGILPELLAYQGLAHLGLGESTRALDFTRRAVLALAQGEVSDEVISEIYYAHAMALAAHGEESQARTYFTRAYEDLLAVAAQLEDEPARQAFFHHNPTTRRLMQEAYARGIASAPESGVISRRLPSFRGGRPVRVKWTLDAGLADVALKQAQGAIALRRARLSRLMREAQAQGAAPTVAQLSEILDVSTRTIQRDLAALRQPQAPG
jgi:DNA-binding SARP family transcriptional activator